MSELGDDWSFSFGLVKCQDWAFFGQACHLGLVWFHELQHEIAW